MKLFFAATLPWVIGLGFLRLSRSFHSMPTTFQRRTITLRAFSLTSALESSVKENATGIIIQWMDVTTLTESNRTAEDTTCYTLPLYPLPACYLPTGQPQQLRNTEPRNVKMALDLGIGGRFCVVLSALDTGRIASVGTIFRIVRMDLQNDPASGELARVLLTCQAEELVDIQKINNPKVAQWENRLNRSDEYLIATVCPRPDVMWNTSDVQQISMLDDYNAVSQMYQRGVETDDLPPFSRERLEDILPPLLEGTLDATNFWQIAQDWQSLCYTVREGHQIAMVSDRNELLIDAAMRKGGPLNLPVHVEDLLLKDRQKVQELEVQAQQRWLSRNLDPSIDFQVLLSLNTYKERLEYFASMIQRERKRLEIILQTGSSEKKDLDIIKMEPRKGAWLDDNVWL